jgi:hypothetical protein
LRQVGLLELRCPALLSEHGFVCFCFS